MTGNGTGGQLPFGAALVAGALLLPLSAMSADVRGGYWDEWHDAARRACPSHHLEGLPDVYDELIGAFVQTLPREVQRKASAIASYSQRCADETMGFYCEMAVYVDAFRRLRLLDDFAAFSCKRYKCIELSYCVAPRTGKFG